MFEPSKLALGVTAGGLLPIGQHLFATFFAAKKGGNLGYADGTHYRQVHVEIFLQERLDFLHRTALDHRSKSRITTFVEPVARRSQHDGPKRNVTTYSAGLPRLPVLQRSSGRSNDFERPRNARSIGRPQTFRGLRIERRKGFAIVRDRSRPDFRPHEGIDLRHGGNPVEEGAKVQASAADEDRRSSEGVDVRNFLASQA